MRGTDPSPDRNFRNLVMVLEPVESSNPLQKSVFGTLTITCEGEFAAIDSTVAPDAVRDIFRRFLF